MRCDVSLFPVPDGIVYRHPQILPTCCLFALGGKETQFSFTMNPRKGSSDSTFRAMPRRPSWTLRSKAAGSLLVVEDHHSPLLSARALGHREAEQLAWGHTVTVAEPGFAAKYALLMASPVRGWYPMSVRHLKEEIQTTHWSPAQSPHPVPILRPAASTLLTWSPSLTASRR